MNSAQYEKLLPTFYKYQILLFKVLGLWKVSESRKKYKRILYILKSWLIFVVWFSLINTMMLVYFVSIISQGIEVIRYFYMFATMLAVLLKYYAIRQKNSQIQELIERMHSSTFRPENLREVVRLMKAERLSRRIRNAYAFLAFISVNSMHALRYRPSTLTLPVAVYTPFEIDRKWRYLLIFLYEYTAISISCYLNIAFDSITSSFLIYTKGQLDILADRIEHLGADCCGGEKKLVFIQIKECIFFHGEIWKLSKIIEEFMGFPVSAQMGFSTLVLIANFYALSLVSMLTLAKLDTIHWQGSLQLSASEDFMEIVIFIVYQFCMLCQIFLFCYFSNEVTLKSADLSHSLYMSEWYSWSEQNRKLLLLMMQQLNTPIRIKSIISSYSFGLASFSSIVNSSYSYFALLKKINN